VTKDTILLVEDDENDAFFLKRAIRKAGIQHQVQVAQDGQAAIDYLEGKGKFGQRNDYPLPALILLDLKLPLVMGLEVLRWIRQTSGLGAIVIVLSSSAEQTDVEAAYRLGANAYLVKPSEAGKLEGMANALKDFWLLQNTPPSSKPTRRVPWLGSLRRELSNYERSPLTGSQCQAPETDCHFDL
jgi:CheY-like chemotaxis protein